MKQNRSPTKSAERRLNNSITYRSRIVSVSISYQSRIVLVSSSYRSPIVLASGSGNNTETIRKQEEKVQEILYATHSRSVARLAPATHFPLPHSSHR